jgi:hypothetical protein
MLNGADKRLTNVAVGLYAVLEIVVIVYVAIWIWRGY